MDSLSVIGIAIGLIAILGGNFMEGGHIDALVNGPAMVIVFGGTLGAILLQTSPAVFFHAILRVRWILFPPRITLNKEIEQVVEWSQIARREGLLGLEAVVGGITDPFAKKGLQLLVDGCEPEMIRECLEVDLSVKEHHDIQAAKVFESMGGYSPTIGIIGAVMGLIHVMQNLSDPSKLGSGIATAFVATIYGVGLANLLFLPMANKIKGTSHKLAQSRELVIEGLISIAEGENPRNIELKLQGFLL